MFEQGNLFNSLPNAQDSEVFDDLIKHPLVRIERILSHGQRSPDDGWYDQDEHEWVSVLQGEAELTFENGEIVKLHVGDYINIPANTKHKVSWTKPNTDTVWLAVFYPATGN
ncbi:cupin domain-containing protein [Enterovibrio nigricans]|uniref:Cupin 2 domain-containing protein n=1 Tax=Enterovibrio nigricans DSM 22720 TaxID=1121868 RepID=A0A1T4V6C2_9GAMM|nr:cupin domain-containing protein [Enterovibrio nigricans]PKF50390.1 cupin domain-containing protein [Enterovibrio nigricans]SKA60071.1 cupin 2 domain-containing protein [Enterovibrio nigricans DSM 22720]